MSLSYQRAHTISPLRGLFVGLSAGLVATWVMTRFQSLVRPPHNSTPKSSETEEESATIKLAERINQALFHQALRDEQKEQAGELVHYAFGTLMGGIFGVATEYLPLLASGNGLAFATAIWGLGDEIAVPAFGLSKPARAYPLKQHLYGLTSHAVYGLSLGLTRQAARTAIS